VISVRELALNVPVGYGQSFDWSGVAPVSQSRS
jgi:hypothetical protein